LLEMAVQEQSQLLQTPASSIIANMIA
jgi:hypothetical protein